MRFGLHALGIGHGADPRVVGAVARSADRAGFATLWCGEHVVMVDGDDTRYPYSPDGRIAVPSDARWLDPFSVLAFAAAVTERIGLATGVLLLPEHNPVVVAKQAASLDALSGGRFRLGVGVGWSAAEFAALGVAFEGRAARAAEYVEAMRVLWRDEVSTFRGTHVRFDRVRCYPKPVRGDLPVTVGGNTDAALDRVARLGDGWYGFGLPRAEVEGRLGALEAACRARGRTPSAVHVAVNMADGAPDDVAALAALGVDELVLVASPPADPAAAGAWVGDLARTWSVHPAGR
ncbi:MAG: LLM class F420-dependent oxidoreductase [Acidimicrobiales bacterium]